ncbi:salt stress protein, Slr1339 family [Okeania sp. SIO2G5]|uniref:salt stress protein, Slr1339 family n=1 Tax=Okeania sp. SIO2G5 TaxID=2607796 RepID=UPI0013BF59A9|nr:hypothetical protein [Okeania sp. SIO2G5]NEP76473.1 hypothetical protein [Okeania sp. SIO2G5]
MGNSVDDLLNAIKQEYKGNDSSQTVSDQDTNDQPSTGSFAHTTPNEKKGKPASQKASTSSPSDFTHPLLERAESIDDLLDDLGVASSSSPPSPLPFSTVRESGATSAPPSSGSFSVPAHQTSATDSVLAQVKQQYAAEEAEQERKRQEALEADRRLQQQLEEQARQQQIAEERRQQELAAQRKAASLKKAQDWLKELDPNSDEGFWFESFSVNYSSKLEAALEYLSAMEQAEA